MTGKILGRCVFCGVCSELTGEHFWPDWTKSIIPRPLKSYRTRRINITVAGHHETIKRFNGDPHHRKIQCVCSSCNNGWMSKIQKDTRPLLTRLMLGETFRFGESEQLRLVKWATMAIMCSEFSDPESVAIFDSDRRYFYENRKAPTTVKLWIGTCQLSSPRSTIYHHHPLIVSTKYFFESERNRFSEYNTQATTYILGKLLIHAFSSIDPRVVDVVKFTGEDIRYVRPIWPLSGYSLNWPTFILTDKDVDRIALTFYESFRRVAEKAYGITIPKIF